MGSTKTEKESNTLRGSMISVVCLTVCTCLASNIYFVLNSAKVKKKNWKCDSEKLFE